MFVFDMQRVGCYRAFLEVAFIIFGEVLICFCFEKEEQEVFVRVIICFLSDDVVFFFRVI